MIYSQLGSTELSVSRLGLGTVQLGMPYGIDDASPPDDSTCIALVREALDAGINYIDTASAYGRSEALVGRAIAAFGREVVVCTKVSLPEKLNKSALIHHLHSQLDTSRRLLQRDELQLVKLHSQQGAFTYPDLFDAMNSFTERGWVRHWGVSTYGSQAPLHALDFNQYFRALQIPYNALDRGAESALFAAAAAAGTGLIARSAFLQGLLTDRFPTLPPALDLLQPALCSLRDLAHQGGISLAELALRYVAHQPAIHSTLFGTTSVKELRTNLRFGGQGPLPDDLLREIQTVEVSDPRLLNPGNWQKPAPSFQTRSTT